jgi:transcriptional regulator with XRE-family HTH domain
MTRSIQSPAYRRLVAILTAKRQALGLTQQQLADKLDRPQSFVAKYELRERRLDVIEFLEVAAYLKLSPGKVLQELRKTSVDDEDPRSS